MISGLSKIGLLRPLSPATFNQVNHQTQFGTGKLVLKNVPSNQRQHDTSENLPNGRTQTNLCKSSEKTRANLHKQFHVAHDSYRISVNFLKQCALARGHETRYTLRLVDCFSRLLHVTDTSHTNQASNRANPAPTYQESNSVGCTMPRHKT